MWSNIVPLVKAKDGNMQHISNYRATALSNASSTISELVFKTYLKNDDPCDMYHFGFAPQLSTRVRNLPQSAFLKSQFLSFGSIYNNIVCCRTPSSMHITKFSRNRNPVQSVCSNHIPLVFISKLKSYFTFVVLANS
jgi:hypothetical protein